MQRKFQVLMIDPPWQQKKAGRRRVRPNQFRELDYPVMGTEQIFMLLDKEILSKVGSPHCVFMWTIDQYLIECEKYMKERNYKRHCRFIWDKTNGVAPAFTIRFSHEYLIWYYQSPLFPIAMAYRGKFRTVFVEKAREHSRKPDIAYAMIEQLYPEADKIDVFSREKRNGWKQFGNQTDYFMKVLLFIHVLVLLFVGCSSLVKDEIQSFIPGTYIRFSQHEYGTEYDTVVISLQNNSAGEYRITRKWKYERMLDGTASEPEYKKTITTGIYNTKHKLVQETESGDIYSFDVKGKTLFNGPIKYQKL